MTLGAVFPNGYASLVQNAFGRMVEVYDGKVRIKPPRDRQGSFEPEGPLLDAPLKRGVLFPRRIASADRA